MLRRLSVVVLLLCACHTSARRHDAPAQRVVSLLPSFTELLFAIGAGDRIDVLGFFSRQITGAEAVTRVLVRDAPVLTVDRTGGSVALTLEVTPSAALLLHEAQALGARPFVTLRSAQATGEVPAGFSDSELAQKVARALER